MCDATPTLREASALAGLAQTLVAWILERFDAGTLPAPPREWTVRENRWLASRYGLDADLIVEGVDGAPPTRTPIRELLDELLERVGPMAEVLEATAELGEIARIARDGSGTERLRRLVRDGATLVDVVHHLADELAADRLPPPA
jgi:carboxylate-amine ligase